MSQENFKVCGFCKHANWSFTYDPIINADGSISKDNFPECDGITRGCIKGFKIINLISPCTTEKFEPRINK